MAEFRWWHIRERLPPIEKSVIVALHGREDAQMPCVAWRRAQGAGGWCWDNGRDECEEYLAKLKYWAHIPILPEKLSFMEERRLGPPHDETDDDPDAALPSPPSQEE